MSLLAPFARYADSAWRMSLTPRLEQMAREGTQVRFLRSIFVPGDEICFLLITGLLPKRSPKWFVARRSPSSGS